MFAHSRDLLKIHFNIFVHYLTQRHTTLHYTIKVIMIAEIIMITEIMTITFEQKFNGKLIKLCKTDDNFRFS